jgi:hypothetical protein
MKKIRFFCILKATKDFGSGSGSVIQMYGSEDPHPDPYQHVTDPEH